MNKKNILSVFVLTVVSLLALGSGIYFANKKYTLQTPTDKAVQNLYALSLKNGVNPQENIALKQYQGKTLLINFWATWCPPCVEEMPELNELHHEYQKTHVNHQLQVVGIAVDSPSNIQNFAQQQKIDFPLLSAGMEGTELSRQMGNLAGGLPFTALIDEDGRIVKTYTGRLKIQQVKQDVQHLLDEK